MASRLHFADLRPPDLVDLRTLNARDLEPLLNEEIAAWRDELEWQFDQSASLVRRFVDLRALNGCALLDHGHPTGYLYYVLEENKALIGDLYLRRGYRTVEREDQLLRSALEAIVQNRQITRIESQLLMLAHAPERRLPLAEYSSTFDRNFMRAVLKDADLTEGPQRRRVRIERWSDQHHEAAAHLIAAAYEKHIDSRINDQYRSVMGARRFLFNIVQFPGCGVFFRPASFSAFAEDTGRLCGISLASLVAPESGHITQICVSPEMRGTGLGHDLLRRSLETFKDAGCVSASLTVTSENRNAVALYERVGFHTARRFSAYAWEGF
ncbi:MAG: GNAT family N-acetyltransferase [Bryobacteraceae bacterium]|jgi:ribosomal protein S18 acetylase RimI-like enzyme